MACLRTIRQLHSQEANLDALPLDDPEVYQALQAADTIGALQVESRAQQQALVQMKPRCSADIVVEVALIRPGPLQGNMVHPFFRRRNELEPVSYFHPIRRPILAETLGVVIFQEQVMRIAMSMGRFSAGEADPLRRAMSRHRSGEEMARFRRLARDYERLSETPAGLHFVAFAMLMAHRFVTFMVQGP